MIIPLGVGDWSSLSENFQRFRLHNMYITDNPSNPDGVSRVSRPTLTLFTTIGTGPIMGMWRQDNVLLGDWFVVSGQSAYRYSVLTGTATLLGTVGGNGFCKFSGNADRVLILRDGILYSTDGTYLTRVVVPDAQLVGSIETINGYFLLSILNDDRFYWINPGDSDPDPLSFATAERIPDAIISIHVISDEVWFVGSSGPEVWSTTGDANAPFQRINGRVYSDGCADVDTALNIVFNDAPAIIWITPSKSVVVAQGGIQKVSNESVEELLKTATNLRGWWFRHNRHDFVVYTDTLFTIVFDLIKGTWARWDTFLQDNWQAHLGLQSDKQAYAGDAFTNQIWMLDEGISDNGLPIVREVSGVIENTGTKIACNIVYCRVNSGWSPSYGFTPTLELRWSDDQGGTWSNYYNCDLGDKGEYNAVVIYRSLGQIPRPGRIFEFRFADLARFRLDYATVNEPN